MPWILCFLLGFLVAASGTSGVLPSSYGMIVNEEYDVNTNVLKIMNVASVLDITIMNTLFNNFEFIILSLYTFIFELTQEGRWAGEIEGRYIRIPVMIAIGIGGGLLLSLPSIIIYCIPRVKIRKILYACYFVFLSPFVTILTEKMGIADSRYIMISMSAYLISKINR
jgi:hypothetical protein